MAQARDRVDAPSDWTALPGLRRAESGLAESFLAPLSFDIVGLVIALLGVVTLGLVRLARRRPEYSLSKRQFRVGRRVLPFGDITRAILDMNRLDEKRSLSLRFGPPRFELSVHLRQGAELRLDPATRDALVTAIEESVVELPVDPYDPKRRFGRSNAPHHLTRDEALAVLRHPPLPSEPLPITPDPARLRPLPS